MKTLVVLLSATLAACMSLSNGLSPTNDPTLSNMLLAAGPALADYAAYGCIQAQNLPSTTSACTPTTSTNVTQQQQALAQCYGALLVGFFTRNKTCPTAAPTVLPTAPSLTVVPPLPVTPAPSKP